MVTSIPQEASQDVLEGVFYMRNACSPVLDISRDAQYLGGFEEYFETRERAPYVKFVRLFFHELGLVEPFIAVGMIETGMAKNLSPADDSAMLKIFRDVQEDLAKKLLIAMIPAYFEAQAKVDWEDIAARGLDLEECFQKVGS